MIENRVETAQKEVDGNYGFFKKQISQLKKDHLNKFVLLHHKEIANILMNEDDAISIGIEKYGEGNFSVQQINDNSIELGYQSYVVI